MVAAVGPAVSGFPAHWAGRDARRSGGERRPPSVRFAAGRAAHCRLQSGKAGASCHAERHVAVPAVPGPCLAVVETEFLRGTLDAFLDGPAQAGRTGQFGEFGAGLRKHQVVGACVGVASTAADQQPALETGIGRPGQGNARPVVEPQPLRSLAGSVRRPGGGRPRDARGHDAGREPARDVGTRRRPRRRSPHAGTPGAGTGAPLGAGPSSNP